MNPNEIEILLDLEDVDEWGKNDFEEDFIKETQNMINKLVLNKYKPIVSQDEVIEAQPSPIKIWDIIQNGKKGEVYRAKSGGVTWEGIEIQVSKVETVTGDMATLIIFAKVPSMSLSHYKVGSPVPLHGLTIGTDWEYVETREVAVYKNNDAIRYSALLVSIILRGEESKHRSSFSSELKGDIAKQFKEAVDFLSQTPEKKDAKYSQVITLLEDKMIEYRKNLYFYNQRELIEQSEMLLSLMIYLKHHCWKGEEWGMIYPDSLSEDDLLMIANGILGEFLKSPGAYV